MTGYTPSLLGRADEAEALLSEAVERAEQLLGADHQDTVQFKAVLSEFRDSPQPSGLEGRP